MTEMEVGQFALSLLWTPFVAVMLAKRSEEKKEKEKLVEKLQNLETELAVLQETSVTEVKLRDYISDKFRDSEALQRKEYDRLDLKLEQLAKAVNEILINLPKRKSEEK